MGPKIKEIPPYDLYGKITKINMFTKLKSVESSMFAERRPTNVHKSEFVATSQGYWVADANGGNRTQVIDKNGNIVGDIVDTLAQGAIYIGSALGKTSELAIGTSGTVLKSNGTTAAWAESGVDSGDTITSTAATAEGATLNLYQNSASPAQFDHVGIFDFYGNDDGAVKTLYGRIAGVIEDPTGAAEVGILALYASSVGALSSTPEVMVTPTEVGITATNDGATGAVLAMNHETASPAASDIVGGFQFFSYDDGANEQEYGSFGVSILDPTDGTESAGFGMSLANGSGSAPSVPQFSVNGASGAIGVTRIADGAEGAAVQLTQVSASPAADDEVGYVKGVGYDDAANTQEYGQIAFLIADPTNGTEGGGIIFKTANGAGTVEECASVGPDGFYTEKSLYLSSEEVTATSDGVAASLVKTISAITTNGDSDLDNLTLADGVENGQIKKFIVSAVGNAADSVKITPAKMIGGTQITFAANPLGLGCEMVWNKPADGWVVVSNNGGTIS